MANAIAGVGTTFERWSGSAWQFIAEINAIEGPTMDKENIEVTALDTDGGYDEFITGFMEGGTLTLNMNFSRSGYELMKQDFEIDVARDYRITLPDDEDTTLEFEGLVIEIPLTMEAEDKLTADVTIQVTGEVAIASALDYEQEVADYISGLSTELSASQIADLDEFVKALKTATGSTLLSDAFDGFWLWRGETQESSLRNLAKNAHHGTGSDLPVWDQWGGFQGASGKYINLNYNPATQGVRFTKDNASIGYYSTNDLNDAYSSGYKPGSGTQKTYLLGSNASNQMEACINSNDSCIISNYYGNVLIAACRVNATTIKGYRNGEQIGSDVASNSQDIYSITHWGLASRTSSSTQQYSTLKLELLWYGRSFTVDEMAAIRDAYNTYRSKVH